MFDIWSENQKRILGLRYAITNHADQLDAEATNLLLQRLTHANQCDRALPSIACARYATQLKKTEVQILRRAIRNRKREKVICFHIVLERDAFPADNLLTFDPHKFMETVRYRFRKCGTKGKTGLIVARLHGEFEPRERLIWPHVHGIATGDMVEVIEELKAYCRTLDVEGGPKRKVVVKDLLDWDEQLTYVFQGFWPCRYRGPSATDPSKMVRQRKKQRIPEPYHSNWMLKMHQTNANEMLLVIGDTSLSYEFYQHYNVSWKKAYHALGLATPLHAF